MEHKSDNPHPQNSESLPNFSLREATLPEGTPPESGNDPAPMTQEISELLQKVRGAFETVGEAIKNVIEKALESLRTFLEAPLETLLFNVATPKEWHLYRHAKKGRTRKKYRNRLKRRVIKILTTERTTAGATTTGGSVHEQHKSR